MSENRRRGDFFDSHCRVPALLGLW